MADGSSGAEARIRELGLDLAPAPAPVANYVSVVRSGDLLFLSGSLPLRAGELVRGKLGADVSVEDGREAARICGLNLLAVIRSACGSLDAVRRVVKLMGMVNATPDFADHPKVVNGCSDLMVEVFGDRGRHARSAFGVAGLPMGAAVEVEMIVEVEPDDDRTRS